MSAEFIPGVPGWALWGGGRRIRGLTDDQNDQRLEEKCRLGSRKVLVSKARLLDWIRPGKRYGWEEVADDHPMREFPAGRLCDENGEPYPYVLDSQAFTIVAKVGEYPFSVRRHVAEVRHVRSHLKGMVWAAPMDQMCEDFIRRKWGRTVEEQQRATVDNLIQLRESAPEIPWLLVLQGDAEADYYRCAEMYESAGIYLDREPLVGVGSMCRRQDTPEALRIVKGIRRRLGVATHIFGGKLEAVARMAPFISSCDSEADSLSARRKGRPLREDCKRLKNCANCAHMYLDYIAQVEGVIRRSGGEQVDPFEGLDLGRAPERIARAVPISVPGHWSNGSKTREPEQGHLFDRVAP